MGPGLPSRSSGSRFHLYPSPCPTLSELGEEIDLTLESSGNCGVELRPNQMRRSLTAKQYKFNAEENGEPSKAFEQERHMIHMVRSIRLTASVH